MTSSPLDKKSKGKNPAEECDTLRASRPREANLDRHLGEQKYASKTLFVIFKVGKTSTEERTQLNIQR